MKRRFAGGREIERTAVCWHPQMLIEASEGFQVEYGVGPGGWKCCVLSFIGVIFRNKGAEEKKLPEITNLTHREMQVRPSDLGAHLFVTVALNRPCGKAASLFSQSFEPFFKR